MGGRTGQQMAQTSSRKGLGLVGSRHPLDQHTATPGQFRPPLNPGPDLSQEPLGRLRLVQESETASQCPQAFKATQAVLSIPALTPSLAPAFWSLASQQRSFFFLRLGVTSEAAAAGLHHSHSNAVCLRLICNLHGNARQHQILNPLSEARDQTRILMDTSRVCYH